jgi:WD40 repeat protein
MRMISFLLAVFAITHLDLAVPTAVAQKDPAPDRTPILVLDHRGPHAPVQALAFSPDGSTLYVAGLDKLIHRYVLKGGEFVPTETLRVPVGSGLAGAINAVAVSPDGEWLAVAGRAPVRGEVWGRSEDLISTDTRSLSKTMKQDFGVVYLFNTTDPKGGRVIRGPESAVSALAFANPAPADGHVLVTTGIEWDEARKQYEGVVRVFEVPDGKQLDVRRGLPTTVLPPGVGAWATGPGGKGLRVAVAWANRNLDDPEQKNDGRLIVFDAPGGNLQTYGEGAGNFPLAVRVQKGGGASEILSTSFDMQKGIGRVTARDADPVGKDRVTELPGAPGRAGPLPMALATLTVEGFGEATALVVRDVNRRPAGAPAPHELLLLGPAGRNLPPVPLTDLPANSRPVLAASPNGKFLAIAGFFDNRIEVYDTARLVAKQGAAARLKPLPGAAGGFAEVKFLVGNKLWVGREKATPAVGGLVLDLATRKATANDGKAATDSPPHPAWKQEAQRITGAGFKEITLKDDFQATVVALLPAKPAWNPDLGALVAVAQTNIRNRQTKVILYEAASGKRILDLDGPALKVADLSFSSSQPLLAAVGADHSAYVWSLRNLKPDLPTLEGVVVSERAGEVVIESVQPGAKLPVGSVIEEVGPEKGKGRPVKTVLDLLLVVRAMRVGDTAQLKLKGQANPVPVPVVAGVGDRQPLVTLWVDPIARRDAKGVHDWVGWTRPGLYDTNSPEGEARIGWVTATGDDARPATFEGVRQHRGTFYKHNLLSYLINEADFDMGYKKWLDDQPKRPVTLDFQLENPTEQQYDRVITRQRSAQLSVTLHDPQDIISPEQAVLRWRTRGAGGAAGEWQETDFTTGRGVIDLTGYPWARGEHRFEFALFRTRAIPYPELQSVYAFDYIPSAPVATVFIDGKEVRPGDVVETRNPTVTVSVGVEPGPEDPAEFTMTAGDGQPVKFLEHRFGFLAGRRVMLQPESKSEILVTARTSAPGAHPDESHTVGVTVRRLPQIPPPLVSLRLITPHQPRTAPNDPFLTDSARVSVDVSVKAQAQDQVMRFEVDLGNGNGWRPAALKPKGVTRLDVDLPADGKPRTIRAKATSANGLVGEDTLTMLYTALPGVALDHPPERLTGAELGEARTLELTGRLEIPGSVDFTLHVSVACGSTGQTRETKAEINLAARTWKAVVPLCPGENRIGLVIRNPFRVLHMSGVITVHYARPPVLIDVPDIVSVGGVVAPVVVSGVTPASAGPGELRVNGQQVSFTHAHKPARLLGLEVWTLRAEGVPVADAKKASVVVHSSEGDSPIREANVIDKPAMALRPPRLSLLWGDSPIRDDQMSERADFQFTLRVRSDTELKPVEVWHGMNPAQMEPVPGAGDGKAEAVDGGFALEVNPTVRLRDGTNYIRVVVNNAEARAERTFHVTYKRPGVRVEIKTIIDEQGAGGKPVPLKWSSKGMPLEANGRKLHVHGSVEWDDPNHPVARDENLWVVFSANFVAHPGVRVPLANAGDRKRAFDATVYVNDEHTTVRVELRSGSMDRPLPQQGSEALEFTVNSKNPLKPKEQRLHVLVIGVNVPQAREALLARQVIEALHGKHDGDLSFTNRVVDFEQPEFTRAMIYKPLLGYGVTRPKINELLRQVEQRISQSTRQEGQEWVNDIVVVYYEGSDLVGSDGLIRLHTSKTLGDPASAEAHAVILRELEPTSGLRLPLLNVENPRIPRPAMSPFEESLPLLRYAWNNAADREKLLPILEQSVATRRTVGKVVEQVRNEVLKTNLHAEEPTEFVPDQLQSRVIGPTVIVPP